MSSKKVYDLSKQQDIDELNRLVFEEAEEVGSVVEEHISDSDESDTDDHVEVRSVESDTDHEISDQEISEESSDEEQRGANYFLGK